MRNEILELFKALANEKYKKFSEKIVSNAKILGVKIPELKKASKSLLKTKSQSQIIEFLNEKVVFHEEFLLKALLINYIEINVVKKANLMANFVNNIPNWAVCDTLCMKQSNNLDIWHDLMMKFVDKKAEFQKRFFYVFMLKNFIDKENLKILFKVLNEEKSEFYYIKIAAAWAICEFGVKFENEIFEFLKTFKNEQIKKMAISKIKQSLRFSDKQKNKFNKLAFNSH